MFVIILLLTFITINTSLEASTIFVKKLNRKKVKTIILINKKLYFIYFTFGDFDVPNGFKVIEKNIFSEGFKSLSS